MTWTTNTKWPRGALPYTCAVCQYPLRPALEPRTYLPCSSIDHGRLLALRDSVADMRDAQVKQ